MIRKLSKAGGFTFIEIVIAISILSVIMSVTYSSLNAIVRGKKLLDDRRDAKAIADTIVSRVSRELQLAYSGLPLLPPRARLDQPNSARLNLQGESDKGDNGRSQDKITFLALEGGQYLPDGGTHTGVVQITYRVEEDPEQSNDPNRTYLLIREETPHIRPFERAYKSSMIFPVTDRLVSLRFRYFDRGTNEWSATWGQPPRVGLPALVEVALTVRSPEGRLDSYTTAVALRAQDQ